jgi:hypothetical protein
MTTARGFYPTMLDYAGGTDPAHDGFLQSVIDSPAATATHAAFSDWLAERGRHVESLRHHVWAVDPKFDVFAYDDADYLWLPEFKGITRPLARLRVGITRAECPLVVTGTPKTLAAMRDWPWPYGAKVELGDVGRIGVAPRSPELRYVEAVPGLWKDEHLAVIEAHTPLRVADIFPGDVKQANIDRLAALPELERLSVQGSHLGDATFGGTGRFPALRRLSVRGGEGVTLGRLGEVEKLESLELKDVQLDRTAGEELQRLQNLRHLVLDNVSGVDLSKLLPKLKSLESLEITDCLLPATVFTKLAGLPELTRLQVWAVPLGDKEVRAISRCSRLTSLRLGDARIATPAAEQLGRLRSLRELVLDARTLPGSGFRFLAGFPHLVHLRLEPGDVSLTRALAGVAEMRNLRILDLRGGSVKAADVSRLAGLEKLHTVQLSSNDLDDAGFAHLCKMQQMVCLELFHTGVTPRGFGAVRGLPRLRKVMFRDLVGGLRKDAVARLAKHLPFADIDA